jgi:hypothetical protein
VLPEWGNLRLELKAPSRVNYLDGTPDVPPDAPFPVQGPAVSCGAFFRGDTHWPRSACLKTCLACAGLTADNQRLQPNFGTNEVRGS